MRRWGWFAAAYAGMALVAVLIAMGTRGEPPLSLPRPWLPLSPPRDVLYSVALGVTIGMLLVIATRFAVPRFAWAKRLHLELRPFAKDVTTLGIVMLALTSSLGEELLFRGLLQPWLGLWLQALLFGVLHQMAGPSRWVWAGWATVVGLLFGSIFALTGSLAGPLAAHAVVNGLNLAYLKNHDPGPRRGLGGLLAERS